MSAARIRGFTLVEILVVLVIISIVTAVGLLSLGSLGANPAAENAAQKLAAVTDLAAQQAVMRGQQYGLRVSPHAYEFLVYDGTRWSPVNNDELLRRRQVDSSVTLSLRLQGTPIQLPSSKAARNDSLASDTASDQTGIEPQILLLSSGELTPFTITVSGAGAKTSYRVTGDLLHGIRYVPPEQNHAS
jgi:general secretion pathway protein H